MCGGSDQSSPSAGRRPLVVGLTGNIGAGKSTVAEMFGELGAAVLDADALARQVTRPPSPTLDALVQAFGPAILDEQGELDRGRLAARVFSDDEARRRLEAITHPAIARALEGEVRALGEAGRAVVIYEATLLVETGRDAHMDRLVVVVAGEAVQVDRLVAERGLGEAEARSRLASQLPERDKVSRAHYVIDNSGPVAETRRQVREVWAELARDADKEEP